MKKTLRVAVTQHTCNNDSQRNLQTSIQLIREASAQGANLILLQELHRSLYFCQTEDISAFDLAETIPGPSTDALSAVAAELNIVIVASLFEKRAAGLYHNTAVVLDTDGSIAGKYRKMHIPDDPGYYEKFYFTPGDLNFTPIKTSLGKLGVLICWDQWYPEAARLMTLAGADLLLYPTAIGWHPKDSEEEQKRQLDAWVTIQRAHAVANGTPVLVSNRIGQESDPSGVSEGIQFWGHSFIAGCQGEFLATSDSQTAGVNIAEINLDRTDQTRRMWPFLRDRRIDAYDALTKRYID